MTHCHGSLPKSRRAMPLVRTTNSTQMMHPSVATSCTQARPPLPGSKLLHSLLSLTTTTCTPVPALIAALIEADQTTGGHYGFRDAPDLWAPRKRAVEDVVSAHEQGGFDRLAASVDAIACAVAPPSSMTAHDQYHQARSTHALLVADQEAGNEDSTSARDIARLAVVVQETRARYIESLSSGRHYADDVAGTVEGSLSSRTRTPDSL